MFRNLKVKFFNKINHIISTGSLSNFHTAPCLNSIPYRNEKVKCARFKSYNDKIYPPQSPDEPRRPAFVCHVKEDIKYSYKKMWYIACLIRGMSIDEALKQLSYINKMGAVIVKNTLLEAQELAVKEHHVEFQSNLWVSESFVGKSFKIQGLRRSAFGKMKKIEYKYIHYFVTLEEGEPPEYYYYHKRPKSGDEMFQEWLQEMRNRKVICAI